MEGRIAPPSSRLRTTETGFTAQVRVRTLSAPELTAPVERLENHRAFRRSGVVETGRAAHPGLARPTRVACRRKLGDG